jgi:hypothetical protein
MIFSSCIFLGHFGIASEVLVPFGVLLSSLSLTWMNSKYSGIQQDFIAGISNVQKSLEHSLKVSNI